MVSNCISFVVRYILLYPYFFSVKFLSLYSALILFFACLSFFLLFQPIETFRRFRFILCIYQYPEISFWYPQIGVPVARLYSSLWHSIVNNRYSFIGYQGQSVLLLFLSTNTGYLILVVFSMQIYPCVDISYLKDINNSYVHIQSEIQC